MSPFRSTSAASPALCWARRQKRPTLWCALVPLLHRAHGATQPFRCAVDCVGGAAEGDAELRRVGESPVWRHASDGLLVACRARALQSAFLLFALAMPALYLCTMTFLWIVPLTVLTQARARSALAVRCLTTERSAICSWPPRSCMRGLRWRCL